MNPETFTLHEVAGGVWAAEADFTKPSVGNAAIVDAGNGKTIVFDTFMTALAARELRSVAEALTGNSVHLAVNSHWHGDHTNGNQVFSDVPIVSTHLTLEKVREQAPTDTEAWQEELRASIDGLTEAAEGGDPDAAARIELLTHFHAFAGEFRLTLPDLLVEERLVVAGEREVVITTLGRGHTVSDVFAWLPDEQVVITGDLCWAGIHPRMNDGFPVEWATYVEGLVGLDPKHVIPGHGAPGDASLLSGLPDYFRAVPELVDAVRSGTDPQEIEPPSGSGDWDGLPRFRAGIEVLARRDDA